MSMEKTDLGPTVGNLCSSGSDSHLKSKPKNYIMSHLSGAWKEAVRPRMKNGMGTVCALLRKALPGDRRQPVWGSADVAQGPACVTLRDREEPGGMRRGGRPGCCGVLPLRGRGGCRGQSMASVA